jgi:AmmeMemoRadiSam system protein B
MGSQPARIKTRPTIVDGIFYPAERGKLRAMVEGLLSGSAVEPTESYAVISPHAGYAYAGEVIAAAFRSISHRKVKNAVLLGPVHRDPLQGVFLPESDVFSTPLGPVPVNRDAVSALLAADPAFTTSDVPHLEEHCLEVQLPFLVHLFPEASIVPMLIGRADLKTVEVVSKILRLTFETDADYTVYIASANMASYMRGTDTAKESETVMRMIEGRDWRGLAAAADSSDTSSCGTTGIAVVISMGGKGLEIRRLAQTDSRVKDGDAHRTVHYASYSLIRGTRR